MRGSGRSVIAMFWVWDSFRLDLWPSNNVVPPLLSIIGIGAVLVRSVLVKSVAILLQGHRSRVAIQILLLVEIGTVSAVPVGRREVGGGGGLKKIANSSFSPEHYNHGRTIFHLTNILIVR